MRISASAWINYRYRHGGKLPDKINLIILQTPFKKTSYVKSRDFFLDRVKTKGAKKTSVN